MLNILIRLDKTELEFWEGELCLNLGELAYNQSQCTYFNMIKEGSTNFPTNFLSNDHCRRNNEVQRETLGLEGL